MVVGLLFILCFHHLTLNFLGTSEAAVYNGGAVLDDTPHQLAIQPGTDDQDQDGLPDEWEEDNGHNPSNPSDAKSDFDRDGLNAVQEYYLSKIDSSAGKPLGQWVTETVALPAGFTSVVSFNLIAAANNGRVLAAIRGRFNNEPQALHYLTHHPQSGWTMVELPRAEYPGNITYVQATDVNGWGDVVGRFEGSSGTRGFLCEMSVEGGAYEPRLFELSGGLKAVPTKISDSGYTIGYVPSQNWRNFLAFEGSELPLSQDIKFAEIADVNFYGECVGSLTTYGFVAKQFISSPHQAQPFYSIFEFHQHLQGFVGIDYPDVLWDTARYLSTENGWEFWTVDRPDGQNIFFYQNLYGDIFWENEAFGPHNPPGYATDVWGMVLPGAVNDWGEFAGIAEASQLFHSHLDPEGEFHFQETGFYFNGDFFLPPETSHKFIAPLYPRGLSSDGRILCHNGILWVDQVAARLNELIPNLQLVTQNVLASDNGILHVGTGSLDIPYVVIKQNDDFDSDGMPNDWEKLFNQNPLDPNDALMDSDGDGRTNFVEFKQRTSPLHAPTVDPSTGEEIDLRPGIDTDGDGIPNVWEWHHDLNYNDNTDGPLDYDRDGFSNLEEFRLDTDPRGAPHYSVREIEGLTGVKVDDLQSALSSATLGDGMTLPFDSDQIHQNFIDTLYFTAGPASSSNGGRRPATWSRTWAGETTHLEFATSHGSAPTLNLAQSPSGAALSSTLATPRQFIYWASPKAHPITLSGAPNQNNVAELSNTRISPGGSFVVGTRRLTSDPATYQPIVWKMPLSSTTTFRPIPLIPPEGVALKNWATLQVNDHGYVIGNGTVSGRAQSILWKVSPDATSVSATLLQPLVSGSHSNSMATGISNHEPVAICGTSSNAAAQTRAVVWNAAGQVSNLGTLQGGNASSALLISRSGLIAGISNVVSQTSILRQPFLAKLNPATNIWEVFPQGKPLPNNPVLSSINDSGEILGTVFEFEPEYRQLRTIWRHGRSYSIDSCTALGSEMVIENVTQMSQNGSLLGRVWKNGALVHVILTPDSDTDGDGLPDVFENQNGLNAFAKNPHTLDSDGDGLSDLQEFQNKTKPRHSDTDGDGMKDGWEVSWGLLPHDPSDALLDPDQDGVRNLRESQLGTSPVGVYRLENQLATSSAQGVYPVTVADDGKIVFATQEVRTEGFQNDDESWEELRIEYYLLNPLADGDAGIPVPLVPLTLRIGYRHDTHYTSSFSPSYFLDPEANQTHAQITQYEWSADSSLGYLDYLQSQETIYLLPNASSNNDPATWIPMSTVEENLRNDEYHNGNAPLLEGDIFNHIADGISPSGTRRVYMIDSYTSLVLNQNGEFVERLEGGFWRNINDDGVAARIGSRYAHSSDSLNGINVWTVELSTGEAFDLPSQGFFGNLFTVIGISNDGCVLIKRNSRNEQGYIHSSHFILNTQNGQVRMVRQPGIGTESIDKISCQNQRLVGSGPEPFQITPDGTCIRLRALRIQNHSSASVARLGDILAGSISPIHIGSDGTITLSATNSGGQASIFQVISNNDSDGNGVPDDWEENLVQTARDIFGLGSDEYTEIRRLVQNGQYGAQTDFDGDGYSAAQELKNGTNDADPADSFKITTPSAESHDEYYVPTVFKNRRWLEYLSKHGAMQEFPFGEEDEDPEGSDEQQVEDQQPPKYYLRKIIEETIQGEFENSGLSSSREAVIEWDPKTQQNIVARDYSSGSWYTEDASGSWTDDQTPGAEPQGISGDPAPGSAGRPNIVTDVWGHSDHWLVYDETSDWMSSSPIQRSRAENGSWESDHYDGQRGNWSNTATESLEQEFTNDLLIRIVDESIQEQIDEIVEGGNELTYLDRTSGYLQVARELYNDETTFRASIADYQRVSRVSNDQIQDSKSLNVGWYELVQLEEGEWDFKFHSKEFLPSSDPDGDSVAEVGPIERLECEKMNQRKGLRGASGALFTVFPSVLDLNGAVGGQYSLGVMPRADDAQLALCSVGVSFGNGFREFLEELIPEELESDITVTKIGGEGSIRIFKKANPQDSSDQQLEELKLPLRMKWSDPTWGQLYVEGKGAGLVKLGMSFTTPMGLRLSAIRSVRVVPELPSMNILEVNDCDHDGDGIPSFADGLIDKFNSVEDRNFNQTPSNPSDTSRFPSEVRKELGFYFGIDEWNSSVEFTEEATISFQYDASDPSLMSLGDEDEMGSRVSIPADGSLRLWKPSSPDARSIKCLSQGGHFARSGVAYNLDAHGASFKVEAVKPSVDINDLKVVVTIDPDGPGGVPPATKEFRFTAIGMSVQEILPNNQFQRRLSSPVSISPPYFVDNGKYLQVSQIQYNPGIASIQADLNLSFDIASDALNLTDNADLRAPKVFLAINGVTELGQDGKPREWEVTMTDSASNTNIDLRKPRDRRWSGNVSLDGARVSEGTNHVELLVVDMVHGFRGSVKHVFEVEAIPGDDSDTDNDSYLGYTFVSPLPTWDSITRTGRGSFHPYTIRLEGPNGFFNSHSQSMIFNSDPSKLVPIVKHQTNYFMGVPQGWSGPAVFAKIPKLVNDPEYQPDSSIVEGEGIDEFAGTDINDDEVLGKLKYARAILDVNRDGDVDENDVLADLERLALREIEDRLDLRFYLGYMKGFVGNPIDNITETIGLGKMAFKLVWRGGVENSDIILTYFINPVKGSGMLLKRVAISVDAAVDRMYQWCIDHEEAIGRICIFLYRLFSATESEVNNFLVSGQLPGDQSGVYSLPEEWRVIIDVFAIIYSVARDSWLDLTPEQRGYVFGYLSFEIASTTVFSVVTALSGGTAAPVLGVKLATTLRLAFSTLKKLTKVHKLAGPIDDILAKIRPMIPKLLTTRMCFVAGTLVLTANGHVPIESITPGTAVWSRDEITGEVGWKPVVECFTTHPVELIHLQLDSDGDGDADEVISGTAEHPFWEAASGQWIEMGDLAPGHRLMDKQGATAVYVLATQRQNAPPEQGNFTTYNFEVEDFHTYFVGESGVWVHNTGKGHCQKIFALYHRYRAKAPAGETPYETLKRMYERMQGATGVGGGKPDKIPSLIWGRTSADVTQEMLTNYSGDLAKFPTVTEWKSKFFAGVKHAGVDVHHSVETYIQKLIGITDNFDDCPGIALPRNQGILDDLNDGFDDATKLKAIHQGSAANGGLAGTLKQADNIPTNTTKTPQEIVQKLSDVYNSRPEWENLWPVTRDWLRQQLAAGRLDPGITHIPD